MAKKAKLKRVKFPYLKEIPEENESFIKQLKKLFLRQKFIGNTQWSKVNDDDANKPADGADVTADSDFVNITYPNDIAGLQSQIDGKIVSWFTDTDPSETWTGTDASHTGDMWWNTSTKKLKRWDGEAWSADIEDQKAIDAYNNAATAQDTADGKRRVFTVQPTTPYDVGDLWSQGPEGELMKCKTARGKEESYHAEDWEKANKYTEGAQAGTNLVNEESSILFDVDIVKLLETFYGPGVDGDKTIVNAETVTLTSDIYYNNLTIDAGGTLKPNGYRVFVKGTLTNNGTISVKGGDGEDGTETGWGHGGSASGDGYLNGGGDGGDSITTGDGEIGESINPSLGSNGGAGGKSAGDIYSGGGGGTATPPPVTSGSFKVFPAAVSLYDFIVGARLGGGGGGGGAGGVGGRGGGGGAGGGIVLIVAKELVNNGSIIADGGKGGDGYQDDDAGGGGGGGGAVILVYNSYSGSGTKTANGGAKGNSPTGNDGVAGTNGLLVELQT